MPVQYRVEKIPAEFDEIKLQQCEIPKAKAGYVVIKLQAASTNFRDMAILKGMYPLPLKFPVVPGSDGAGHIVEVGEDVEKWKVGDYVSCNFFPFYIDGKSIPERTYKALGGTMDGCFQEYVAVPAVGVVKLPESLSPIQASTLPCAGLTAWNALFGDKSKALQPGQNVLIQGTGGVSIFALQFAVAAGANVTVTSSSKEKLEFAKKLGARRLINYRETPQWGQKALELTNNEGYHHVVEVGGKKTFKQSLQCLAPGGVITSIGFIASEGEEANFDEFISMLLHKGATIRGIFVGSTTQYEDMLKCIEANDIKPVVAKVFPLQELKDAYEFQWQQKHIGNIVLKISD
ncbi:alcohol dehydrogenase [Schizosaccharomyces japonicus yFS275]|uniref:Alcohol dehydrogenase n=1 Tax=Schizosaccharomyces japonicus (strain yFS275 / FY16936) TaxID=402676 RepID=B6JZE8_SCHJY|nr:alcohol dehydrogenase [Schizosaccharomyces japonicus yFS275]EEB06916.1 alcohol dehydrogenase [Schizosaccharomyces japonicus yFS275]